MAKRDKMPGYAAFQCAADLATALMPAKYRGGFDGNCRDAHKIYKALDTAYRLGLIHGALADDNERRRMINRVGKRKGITHKETA